MPTPDALKDGRYAVLGSLGEGTQGHTFDGVDRREGRAVAIKRFDVRTAKTWKDAELAERETRVLRSLSHPRLPRYFDHFEQDGALYLVMEKIDGESLAALRKRGAVLSESDVVRLLRDASEVLDYLHGRAPPVIHRDLKPGNVIRKPDGSFAFVDFGAVRDKLRPTGGSTVVGTFGFMAPEQFQGRALPASDVYAVGATALSMLTGVEPQDLPHKGLAIDVRGALRGRVDGRLVDALVAMLDPDPDRRPGRIAPLLERLGTSGRAPAPGRETASRDREARAREARARGESARWERWRESFERQAEQFESRARSYERRAASGGPGAQGWVHGAAQWHRAARQWRESFEKQRLKAERQSEHRARRQARREARRAEHAARRAERTSRGLPWPVRSLFMLGLALAMLAVSFAMQIVVPAVLVFLSLFLGRGANLRHAARAVRDAGHEAIENMNRMRQWVASGARSVDAQWPDTARVRVRGAGEDPHVRVEPGVSPDEFDDEFAPDEATKRR